MYTKPYIRTPTMQHLEKREGDNIKLNQNFKKDDNLLPNGKMQERMNIFRESKQYTQNT